MIVERTNQPYTRKTVREDNTSMYIFTDNTDRDSGKTLIPSDSWYVQKYGENYVYMQSPKIGKNTWTLKEAKESILNDTTLEDTNINLIDGIIELDKFLKENGKKTTDI